MCTSFDPFLLQPIHVYYFLIYDIIPPFPDLISNEGPQAQAFQSSIPPPSPPRPLQPAAKAMGREEKS